MKLGHGLATLGMVTACAVATAGSPGTDRPNSHLIVPFGKATFMQQLYYEQMYEKKPFRDAILFYYDNGIYKILSEGEAHYGTYAVEGSFKDETFRVHYVSLPSVDWGHTSAYHTLVFYRRTGRFVQQAVLPSGKALSPQEGKFLTDVNPAPNPSVIDWQRAKHWLKPMP